MPTATPRRVFPGMRMPTRRRRSCYREHPRPTVRSSAARCIAPTRETQSQPEGSESVFGLADHPTCRVFPAEFPPVTRERAWGDASLRRSSPLTAAGQRRICTGLPGTRSRPDHKILSGSRCLPLHLVVIPSLVRHQGSGKGCQEGKET
jgi:hypothetical protein